MNKFRHGTVHFILHEWSALFTPRVGTQPIYSRIPRAQEQQQGRALPAASDQWNFAGMRNKWEFRIWVRGLTLRKRMKYERVVGEWRSRATGVSFLGPALARLYRRMRHTFPASVIFHLRRDVRRNPANTFASVQLHWLSDLESTSGIVRLFSRTSIICRNSSHFAIILSMHMIRVQKYLSSVHSWFYQLSILNFTWKFILLGKFRVFYIF